MSESSYVKHDRNEINGLLSNTLVSNERGDPIANSVWLTGDLRLDSPCSSLIFSKRQAKRKRESLTMVVVSMY
jgi:hypothetical protein